MAKIFYPGFCCERVLLHSLSFPRTSALLPFGGITCDPDHAAQDFVFFVNPRWPLHYAQSALAKAVQKKITGILSNDFVCSHAFERHPHLRYFVSQTPQKAYALAAQALSPKRPLFCAGVTGTNGKTSVVVFAQQLWQLLNKKAASIGTLGVGGHRPEEGVQAPKIHPATSNTTPDAGTLFPLLHRMKEQGVDRVALEVSSHGLHQRRVEGLYFQAGVFTNFSSDHLDYHGHILSYWQEKTRLFQDCMAPQAPFILNSDCNEGCYLRKIAQKMGHPLWDFGQFASFLSIVLWRSTPQGQWALIRYKGQLFETTLPLKGLFQLYNVLASVAVVLASGEKIENIWPLLPFLKGVPGRLDYVGATHCEGQVYIDYAHTPDALYRALCALRLHAPKRLVVVFGCGGNRDTTKRCVMGRIAQNYADIVIITNDNPRTEDPWLIRRDILKECPKALEIPCRFEAIKKALSLLTKDDICLIAGKGHETNQVIGAISYPFSDHETVKKVLSP